LCSTGWPRTCHPPASASRMLGLQHPHPVLHFCSIYFEAILVYAKF
jgi:hypothetical protein